MLCVFGRHPKKSDKGGEEGCAFSLRGSASQEREGQLTTTTASMSKLPSASCARDMAMFCTATRFQAGRMHAGGVRASRTWPRNAWLHIGAWLVLIGAKKMLSMLRGAILAQYLGRSSEGWGVESEISTALWRAKRWLDSRCLKMAPEKTEALLVTDRRSF